MSLRSHLLLLTLVVLAPLSLFGVWATTWVADHEKEIFERGARQRTLALITAVDTELVGHAERLQGLASSAALQRGDLLQFRKEAARFLATQPEWRNIFLTLPNGERILSTSLPDASRPPSVEESRLDEALSSGAPTIGDLSREGEYWLFSVRVPVQAGERPAVLTAMVDPSAILSLLTPQRLPADWVGVVLDSSGKIVARTVGHDSFLGRAAGPRLREAARTATEGWIEGALLEGPEVYTPFNKSARSGWTVALGIPRDALHATMRGSILLLSLGLLVAAAVALILASVYSRRIANPIVALASSARALGWGARVPPPAAASAFRELRDVGEALAASAAAVSEREARLRRADQAKDEFLAMLGHELRNPLSALSAATQTLNVSRSQDPDVREATSVVARQVARMTRLVDDLLDVGRAIAGKVSLQVAPLDLGQVVSQVAYHLERAGVFEDRRVEFDLAPVWVEGDETRMEQIVFNLLENSAKYTRPGGSIAVRVFTVGGDAVLEVSDTGIGMSPDLLPRVFDLFSQGKRSIDRTNSGLGIGLTLVKRLAELHGGSVTARSEGIDRGSHFRVTLPAIEPPEAIRPERDRLTQAGHARKILLVEDNADVRRSMLTILRHYGYRAFEAGDGFEGVEIAPQIRPDAAIVDIGLPRYDGFEVARRLRADPATAGILLVAMTGYGSEDVRERAFDSGFDEYLVKPVTPKTLADVIEERLAAGRRRTDEAKA